MACSCCRAHTKALHQIFNLRAYENDFFSENVSIRTVLLHCEYIFALNQFRYALTFARPISQFSFEMRQQNGFCFKLWFPKRANNIKSHFDTIEMNSRPCYAMKSVHTVKIIKCFVYGQVHWFRSHIDSFFCDSSIFFVCDYDKPVNLLKIRYSYVLYRTHRNRETLRLYFYELLINNIKYT